MSEEKRTSNVHGNEGDTSSSKKFKAGLEDLEELKCPICLQLPKGDVYSCSNGHSVCNECMEKLVSCPTCRVRYQRGRGKIRNHFAEGILSKLMFECSWKEEGCEREGLNRQEVSKHEAECVFNPTPLQLCHVFFLYHCDHEFSPTFLRNPSLGLPEGFLDHVWNVHYEGRRKERRKFPGDVVKMYHSRSFIDNMLERRLSTFQAPITRLLDNDQSRNTIGRFLIYGFVDGSGADVKLSWLAVRISEEPSSCNVTVKMTLKRDAGEVQQDDVSNVETSWNARILSAQEFYLFTKKPSEEQDKFKFSIQWSHIQKYYLNADGAFDLGWAFTVTEDNFTDNEREDSLGSDDDSNMDSLDSDASE